MDPVLMLDETRLAVEPGDETRTTLRIRNAGTIVEQYAIDVLGPAHGFAQVLPPQVSVYPGTDVEVQVVFRPPHASTTPAGDLPFAVRCVSREQQGSSAVAEGDLTVGAIHEFGAQLVPMTSKGRWRGRHRIELENRGNTSTRLQLRASDPDEKLMFVLAPSIVEVPATGRAVAYLRVRGRSPFVKGEAKPYKFQVQYAPLLPGAQQTPRFLDGVFQQRAILGRSLKAAITLATVAVAAVAGVAIVKHVTKKNSSTDDGSGLQPAKPTVTAKIGQALVQWTPDPTATLYTLVLNGSEQLPVKPPLVQKTWSGLAPGQQCFQLQVIDSAGTSPLSDKTCQQIPKAATIKAPQLSASDQTTSSVTIRWTDDDCANCDYIVYVNGQKPQPVKRLKWVKLTIPAQVNIGDEVEVQRATPKNAPWGVYTVTGSGAGGTGGTGGTGNGWQVIVDYAMSGLDGEANAVHGAIRDGGPFGLPNFGVLVVDGGATQQSAMAACNTAGSELAAAHLTTYTQGCLFWTPDKQLQTEDGTPFGAATSTSAPTPTTAAP